MSTLTFLNLMNFREAILALTITVILLLIVPLSRVGSRESGLPPGPPTIPILGNAHQIPKADAHFLITKWASKYGGIFSIKRFRSTTIVISDWKIANELLVKRGAIYGFRPDSVVAHLITRGDHILLMQYGKNWQTIRKLMHQFFMESRCDKEHCEVQEAEASQMLHDFLVDPQNHMYHPKRYSNSITMSLVYGIRTKTIDSPYMTRLYDIMGKFSLVLEFGAVPPVESWPLLQWLPDRLTGNWRKRALEVGDLMNNLYTEVLHQVQDRRRKGIEKECLMDYILSKQPTTKFNEHQLAFLGGTIMEGGSDTSASLILAIVQAMMEYPEVQKKAQAEIDAVIPDSRSPSWSDFSSLPYINMIIKEAHRWRPVTPLGVTHSLGEEDHCNGMRLPKGSAILLNVWGMHMDPKKFNDPESFIPERYADFPRLAPVYAVVGDGDARDHFGYGIGRRICPGIHLAERNMFISIAKLLWAFEFRKGVTGKSDMSAETGSSQGFLHCVKDYDAVISVRGEQRRKVIMEEFDRASAVFERYD